MLPLIRFPIAALAVLLLVAGTAFAKPAVVGVRIGVHPDSTRVVLDLTANLDYRVFTLPTPYRVVIDLPEVEWRVTTANLAPGRGLVQRFRYGLFRPGTSRLVVDVGAPVSVRKVFMLRPTADFGYRLVLDLAAVAAGEFRRMGQPPSAKPPSAPGATAGGGVSKRGGKPVIVIDPGHGGVDPGTTSVGGVYEKHITLAAARELKRQLDATGRYTVVMTRRRDVFISLARRVEIAREAGARLFISLHADAIADRAVRGVSVYTLSENASDAEAEALAAKENTSDIIAGVDLSLAAYDPDVASILIDLAQRDTTNASVDFTKFLTPELGKAARLLRKTHRFAGFRVLKAPDVPSVLIELGYLSNRRDERMLRDPDGRKKLMQAVVRATNRYFTAKTSAERS
ncbi:MAG: N-acetylmuramoyl-L-alanine amidase [Alphaproteobacteria bacterium]